jgi:hypothetical protein
MSYGVKSAAFGIVLVALGTGTGRADVSNENRAAAQALFDQGRSLVKAGRMQDACPKFEESQRLDPGIGTQLNLADCYERTGRTASAWTLYVEVAAAARQAGQEERATHAATRAAALKDKLSRLVIVVPKEGRAPGITVERGSLSVGEAQWGAPMPVDPGSHTVRASAPGRSTWQTTIDIAADGTTKTVTVPPLGLAPQAPVSSVSPSRSVDVGAERSPSSSQKTIAYAAGGLGIAGIAVGSVFGGMAMSKKNDARCEANVCASQDQASTYDEARKAGNVSTIAFAVGGAALAAGVVLYLTAPKSGAAVGARVGVQASIAEGGVGLSARGTW